MHVEIPRMTWAGVVAVALVALVFFMSPTQFPVVMHKLSLVTLAGFVGYWLDRALFPYARPHTLAESSYKQHAFGIAMVRRAIIVGACLVAVAIAL